MTSGREEESKIWPLHPGVTQLAKLELRFAHAVHWWETANRMALLLWRDLKQSQDDHWAETPNPFALADDLKILIKNRGDPSEYREHFSRVLFDFKKLSTWHMYLVHAQWMGIYNYDRHGRERWTCFRQYDNFVDDIFWPEEYKYLRYRYRRVVCKYQDICDQQDQCWSMRGSMEYGLRTLTNLYKLNSSLVGS